MGVLLAWFVAAGIQTVRDVRYQARAPLPSEYVASGVLFGSLSVLSAFSARLATALAWGFLLGMTLEAGGPQQLVAGGFPRPLAKYFSPGASVSAQSREGTGTGSGEGTGGAVSPAYGRPGQATPAIRQVQRAFRRRFPAAVSLGVFSCRHIAGSSQWSQHAWGNAWDIAAVGPVGDRYAAWLVQNANRLPIAQVIWKGRELLQGGSVADHYTHIHVSGAPMATGTPPCAGRGGV